VQIAFIAAHETLEVIGAEVEELQFDFGDRQGDGG